MLSCAAAGVPGKTPRQTPRQAVAPATADEDLWKLKAIRAQVGACLPTGFLQQNQAALCIATKPEYRLFEALRVLEVCLLASVCCVPIKSSLDAASCNCPGGKLWGRRGTAGDGGSRNGGRLHWQGSPQAGVAAGDRAGTQGGSQSAHAVAAAQPSRQAGGEAGRHADAPCYSYFACFGWS